MWRACPVQGCTQGAGSVAYASTAIPQSRQNRGWESCSARGLKQAEALASNVTSTFLILLYSSLNLVLYLELLSPKCFSLTRVRGSLH